VVLTPVLLPLLLVAVPVADPPCDEVDTPVPDCVEPLAEALEWPA
jgi:hypothetical protein